MTELDRRLEACFTAVFAGLDPAAARRASPELLPAWDSIATVTLLAAIEDEFAVVIDMADLEDPSFESLRAILERQMRSS